MCPGTRTAIIWLTNPPCFHTRGLVSLDAPATVLESFTSPDSARGHLRPALHLLETNPAPLDHAQGERLGMEHIHIAFRAGGVAAFLARLTQLGIAYRRVPLDGRRTELVFTGGPDGTHLHVDFPSSKAPRPTA